MSAMIGDRLRVELTAGTNYRLLLTAPWGRGFYFSRITPLFLICHCSLLHIHIAIHTPIPSIQFVQFPPTRLPPLVLVACSLATVLCVAVAVQLCPHAYPEGQHPPPTVSAQLNQPLAHLPVLPELDPVVMGITIVSPSEVNVVDEVVGHDVVSQSRPVWQQPP